LLQGRYRRHDQSILQVSSGKNVDEVPLPSVLMLWEREGRFWKGAGKGAIIGGISGLVLGAVGYTMANGGDIERWELSEMVVISPLVGAFGGLAGGLIGGTIGAITSRWKPTYTRPATAWRAPPRVAAPASPTFAVAVTIRW
jgi:hypothetical protein